MSRQPALAAARASLAAAESGKRGLDSLGLFGNILAPDLHIRKQQACLGISINAAGLQQAEWETRYAVEASSRPHPWSAAQFVAAATYSDEGDRVVIRTPITRREPQLP